MQVSVETLNNIGQHRYISDIWLLAEPIGEALDILQILRRRDALIASSRQGELKRINPG